MDIHFWSMRHNHQLSSAFVVGTPPPSESNKHHRLLHFPLSSSSFMYLLFFTFTFFSITKSSSLPSFLSITKSLSLTNYNDFLPSSSYTLLFSNISYSLMSIIFPHLQLLHILCYHWSCIDSFFHHLFCFVINIHR